MKEDLAQVLSKTLYGNPVRDWAIAVGVAIVAFVVVKTVQALVMNRMKKLSSHTTNKWDDIVVFALGKTKLWFLAVVAVFIGASVPDLSQDVRDVLRTALVLAGLVQAGVWASGAFTAWLTQYQETQIEENAGGVMTMNAIGLVARVVLWSVVWLLALDNLGVDVTALVAGLGVGGIAVALAVQNILGDLFSSLSIALDKPFVIGDFVIVGEQMGTVEHIGIKTTRVRSLSGEQLVFANGDLISSRIRNYGRMRERRVVFKIGVTYGTAAKDLESIPDIIRAAIDEQDNTRFDRSHFSGYGDFSLDFETVYYVLGSDYNLHMDIQQAINLQLYKEFEQRRIEFAFPTRTIILEGGDQLVRRDQTEVEQG